jgi:uncharacterized protein (TIGR03435 family)
LLSPPSERTWQTIRVLSAGNAPRFSGRFASITGKAVDMSALAQVLGRNPALGGRLVVDQTALKGNYNFTLRFAPEREMLMPGTTERPPMPADAPPPPDANAPSIFTAIQEQLGLKLEPTKGPVQTLVIENIEKPSEN